jgi:hypothetical protein
LHSKRRLQRERALEQGAAGDTRAGALHKWRVSTVKGGGG